MKKIKLEVGDELKCKITISRLLYRFTKNSYYKIVNTCKVFIDGTVSYDYYILDDLGFHTPFYFIDNIEDVFDLKIFERKKKLEKLQKEIIND